MKFDKQPIRVAQIVGKWVGGGVESFLMNYYRNIDRTKVQFDFICDDDSINIPYEEIEKLGGKVILVPPYQKIFKYRKKLKEIFGNEKYKIVHSHINTLSIFPLQVAKKTKIPTRIAHSHSTTNKIEWKKNLLKNFLKHFSKVYATDYFACSELAGRYLFGNKTYNMGKVVVIKNAIELNRYVFDEKKREIKRNELNIHKKTLVIGNVGRFVEQKNHSYLLDIFNELHLRYEDSILILVGQGPLQEKIKEKAKKLNLEDAILFLGQRSDMNEIYQAFDIFALPSLYEGLGMALIEAQVSGLPCVCSEGIPKEVKGINEFEFIDLKESPQVWVDYILNLNKKIKRTGHKSEFIKKGYDIIKETKKLEKIYLKLLKEKEEQI